MPFTQMSALDMETNEATVDDQTTMSNTIETPNTSGRDLLRRLRFANEAKAASSSNNNNRQTENVYSQQN